MRRMLGLERTIVDHAAPGLALNSWHCHLADEVTSAESAVPYSTFIALLHCSGCHHRRSPRLWVLCHLPSLSPGADRLDINKATRPLPVMSSLATQLMRPCLLERNHCHGPRPFSTAICRSMSAHHGGQRQQSPADGSQCSDSTAETSPFSRRHLLSAFCAATAAPSLSALRPAPAAAYTPPPSGNDACMLLPRMRYGDEFLTAGCLPRLQNDASSVERGLLPGPLPDE